MQTVSYTYYIRDRTQRISNTLTVMHLLVCEEAGYRHKQARPPQWAQGEQLRLGSGSHGDGCPDVPSVEGQHWLLPPQLSESYPGMSHCLLGEGGHKYIREQILWNVYRRWAQLEVCCECVWMDLSRSPAACFPGLYPNPCIPNLWEVPEPIPGQKEHPLYISKIRHNIIIYDGLK